MENSSDKERFKRRSLLDGTMKREWLFLLVGLVVILILANIFFFSNKSGENVKIGVITDLTGPASYWGESSRVGAELAKEDLKKEGYNVDLIFEDYQLDASKALNAAQKVVNVDGVDGIYAEFNPAAISIGSFVADKEILFVYDAAVTSPVEESELT